VVEEQFSGYWKSAQKCMCTATDGAWLQLQTLMAAMRHPCTVQPAFRKKKLTLSSRLPSSQRLPLAKIPLFWSFSSLFLLFLRYFWFPSKPVVTCRPGSCPIRQLLTSCTTTDGPLSPTAPLHLPLTLNVSLSATSSWGHKRACRAMLGDAPRPPMFPPIFLRHLCIFLLIVASPRRSELAAPIPESNDHVT